MTTSTPTPYRLRRARKGKMLAGVAAGLATASGLDVTVVRICIGASFLSGLGVIGYILLWVVLPEEQPARGRYVEPAPDQTARVIRIALVVAALLGVFHRVGVIWPFQDARAHDDFGFDALLALVLISLGVGVLWSRHRDGATPAPFAPVSPPAPPSTPETFTPWTASAAAAEPDVDDDFDDDYDGIDDDDEAPTFVGPFRDVVGTVHGEVGRAISDARSDPSRAHKPGGAALGWARVVGWIVFLWWTAGSLVLFGLWRFDAVEIRVPLVLAIAVWTAFTVVLNALIRVRKPGALLGTLLVLLLPVGLAQGLTTANGPVGARTLRPTSVPAHVAYRQAMGELEIDLSDAKFNPDRTTEVDARVGTGHMVITLPDDVSVTVVSRIDAGGYDVLGKQTRAGVGQRETLRFDGCPDAPHVRVRMRGGAGYLELKRASGSNEAVCATASAA